MFKLYILLQVGDKVLSVNGTSVIDVDHYYAVEVLKASGPTLTLVVTRDSPNSTRFRLVLYLIIPSNNGVLCKAIATNDVHERHVFVLITTYSAC